MPNRYSAQIRLPEIGKAGQEKLRCSKVFIVGCGALGSHIAMYLAAAGIGNLIIADYDSVDISNLHRQVFFKEKDAGRYKVDLLAERIKALNSDIEVKVIRRMITEKGLSQLDFIPDIVVDAADNPSTTYLLEKYCLKENISFSTAGVSGWQGQVYSWTPGAVPFSDIVPMPSPDSEVLPCSVAGIFGPLASLTASIQASEVIKILLGSGVSFKNQLFTIDILNNKFNQLLFEM